MSTKRMRVIFECENDTVQTNEEIADILRRIAQRVEIGNAESECWQTVFDINGNDIGRFRLKNEDPESGRV